LNKRKPERSPYRELIDRSFTKWQHADVAGEDGEDGASTMTHLQ